MPEPGRDRPAVRRGTPRSWISTPGRSPSWRQETPRGETQSPACTRWRWPWLSRHFPFPPPCAPPKAAVQLLRCPRIITDLHLLPLAKESPARDSVRPPHPTHHEHHGGQDDPSPPAGTSQRAKARVPGMRHKPIAMGGCISMRHAQPRPRERGLLSIDHG